MNVVYCGQHQNNSAPWIESQRSTNLSETADLRGSAQLTRTLVLTISGGSVYLRPRILCVSLSAVRLRFLEFTPQAISCTPCNRGHEKCSFTNPEDTKSNGPLNFWRDSSVSGGFSGWGGLDFCLDLSMQYVYWVSIWILNRTDFIKLTSKWQSPLAALAVMMRSRWMDESKNIYPSPTDNQQHWFLLTMTAAVP